MQRLLGLPSLCLRPSPHRSPALHRPLTPTPSSPFTSSTATTTSSTSSSKKTRAFPSHSLPNTDPEKEFTAENAKKSLPKYEDMKKGPYRSIFSEEFLKSDGPAEGEMSATEIMLDTLKPYPIYKQLKRWKKPMEMPDFSGINEELGVEMEKIDTIPLDAVLFNNPIYRVDHKIAQVMPDFHVTTDEEHVKKIDQFPLRTLVRRQLELEKKATDRQNDKYQRHMANVAALGRASELKSVSTLTLEWFDDFRNELERYISEKEDAYEASQKFGTTTPMGETEFSTEQEGQDETVDGLKEDKGETEQEEKGAEEEEEEEEDKENETEKEEGTIAADVDGETETVSKKKKKKKSGKLLKEEFIEAELSLLKAVSAEKMVILAIHELMGSNLRKDKALLSGAALQIVESIRSEANFSRMNENERRRYHAYHGKTVSVHKINVYSNLIFGKFVADWPRPVKQHVGEVLVGMFLDVARFTVSKYDAETDSIEEVTSSPFLIENTLGKQYLVGKTEFIEHISQHLGMPDSHIRHYPMVMPPKPWISPTSGCYFTTEMSIIRFISYEQMLPIFKGSQHMGNVYHALNVLSSTSWKINKRVMDVITALWELGGDYAEVPPRFDLPPPPVGVEGKSPEWFKEARRRQKVNAENHSLRGSFMLKLDVLREMRDEEQFYFPHNMDFRGRVYPIPGHLNHMGSDIGRGVLAFSTGRPLGVRGFYWLQIHLANLAGKDKASHQERLDYVLENQQTFVDCALKPLSGTREWLNKEDPWQFLAACMEFTEALLSGDPITYISTLPVHQDGTCNGLQHYSALGGDAMGAKSVNVLPSERPQDVYNDVVQIILKLIQSDLEQNHPTAQLLDGKVERKIVKQTIMTSVYGVTFIGARKQIHNALRDRYPNFPEERMFEATVYLASKTFEAIGEMFEGANLIMKWLSKGANAVCKGGNVLTWQTPLGLPVQQPYRKAGKFDHVNTLLQQVVLKNADELPINARRNATAFPPNYVHSLDSTHMMLTAIECDERNLTFASVHDSYWTHAGSIDEMNGVLRDQFVQLYSKPLLDNLRNYWMDQNPDVHIDPVPVKKGKGFDINLVRESPYFFH